MKQAQKEMMKCDNERNRLMEQCKQMVKHPQKDTHIWGTQWGNDEDEPKATSLGRIRHPSEQEEEDAAMEEAQKMMIEDKWRNQQRRINDVMREECQKIVTDECQKIVEDMMTKIILQMTKTEKIPFMNQYMQQVLVRADEYVEACSGKQQDEDAKYHAANSVALILGHLAECVSIRKKSAEIIDKPLILD